MSLLFFLKPHTEYKPDFAPGGAVDEPKKKRKRKKRRTVYEVKKENYVISAEEIEVAHDAILARHTRQIEGIKDAAEKIQRELNQVVTIANILDYLEELDYEH